MNDAISSQENAWHLDKGVGLATIIAAVLFFLGGVTAWYSTVERVASLELKYGDLNSRVVDLLERQFDTDARQDATQASFRLEMRQDTREINVKVDKVLELLITR